MNKSAVVIAFSVLALLGAPGAQASLAASPQTYVKTAPSATIKTASSISTMPDKVADYNSLVHTLQLDDGDFADDDGDYPVIDYSAQMC